MSAIYIQHAHNRSFYYGTDRWVIGRKRARRFCHTQEAIAFCVAQDLEHAQVHVSFGPGAADVLIPIPAEAPVAPASPIETVGE